jgi:DNA polymerase-3 subunit alpha
MQEVLDKKEERDVSIGGVVTATRSGFTKSNKPFGITKLEDFSGTYEIALFGDDWMRFNNYMKEGYFLFIKGRIVPRRFGQDIYELKIGSIELLPDVKDSLIERITITIPLDMLDERLVDELTTLLIEHPGKTNVHFVIHDTEKRLRTELKSRNIKASIQKELINYIKINEGITYQIN